MSAHVADAFLAIGVMVGGLGLCAWWDEVRQSRQRLRYGARRTPDRGARRCRT